MTSTAARHAFTELGYGDKERAQGLPKLDYLAHYDPDLLQAIVKQVSEAEGPVTEVWRRWFETYPSRTIESGPSEGHLNSFRMLYHLLPIAFKVQDEDSMLTAETLVGSAWQFMERTGSFWETGKAFMIVVKLMPSGATTSSSAEGISKIKYVASHIDEVVELIPEIITHRITTLRALQSLVEQRFPMVPAGNASSTESATLDA